MNTIASRRSFKWGLMSSQLSILAPSRIMMAAIAGIGIMAITFAKNSTNSSNQSAELTIARRL